MDDLFSGINIATSALVNRPRSLKLLKTATTGAIRPILVLRELKKTVRDNPRYPKLLWLLENLRFTRTDMAHDQIYGLLGLCSPEEASGNPIRYDLEPEEVFKVSIKTHTHLYNDLEFLGLCTPTQRDLVESKGTFRPFRGPSWVPNWFSTRLRRCLGLHEVQDGSIFNASGPMAADFSFEGNKLAVSGVLVDEIRALGNFCDGSRQAKLSDPNSLLLQQFLDFWLDSASYGEKEAYADSESHAEGIARTLSLLGVYLHPMPAPEIIPTMFYNWCKGSNLEKRLDELGMRPKQEKGQERLFMRMKRLLSWQPLITTKGYIGLAREQCKVGDEVWVVAGCSVPIILSPISRDQVSMMEVQGEAFLDQFMFGEISTGSASNALIPKKVTLI